MSISRKDSGPLAGEPVFEPEPGVSPTLLIDEERLPSFEESMAASIAVQLYYSEGYSGPTLLQQLRARAHREGYRTLSDDTLRRIAAETCGGGDPLMAVLVARDLPTLLTYIPKLAELEAREPVQYAALLGEIRSAFAGREHAAGLRDFFSALASEKRRIKKLKPDVATVAEEWAKDAEGYFAYDTGLEEWRYWNEQYWEVTLKKGGMVDTQARSRLREAEIPVNGEGGLNVFQRTAVSLLSRSFPRASSQINFQNTVFSLDDQGRAPQLLPQRPELGFTSVHTHNYDPYQLHPHITAFLEETIPDEYGRQAYMAHLGRALLANRDYHKFLLLIGPPRSGKSTLLRLANATCGVEKYERFAGASLFARDTEGKRTRPLWNQQAIVCVDEMPAEALKDEEILKSMTAHGGVEMRRLFKDEQTDNQWLPPLILSTNDTPHYKDTSGAIKQRAIIIECPNGPRAEEEQDAMLFKRELLPEVGAFAATCLAFAMRLFDQGYYPRSAEMKELVERISKEGNPLKLFLEDECVLDPDARVPTAVLYARYAETVRAGGNIPMATNNLSRALHDMHIGVEPRHMRYNGKFVRALYGIRLKTEGELAAETEEGLPTGTGKSDDPLLYDLHCHAITVVDGIKRILPRSVIGPDGAPGASPEAVITVMPQKEDTSLQGEMRRKLPAEQKRPVTGDSYGAVGSEWLPQSPLSGHFDQPQERGQRVYDGESDTGKDRYQNDVYIVGEE